MRLLNPFFHNGLCVYFVAITIASLTGIPTEKIHMHEIVTVTTTGNEATGNLTPPPATPTQRQDINEFGFFFLLLLDQGIE